MGDDNKDITSKLNTDWSETDIPDNYKQNTEKYSTLVQQVSAYLKVPHTTENNVIKKPIHIEQNDLIEYMISLDSQNPNLLNKNPNIEKIASQVRFKHEHANNPHLKIVHRPKDGKWRAHKGFELEKDNEPPPP